MSVSPHVATPSRRVNDYTFVIDKGARDGLSEGDSVVLELDNKNAQSIVIDVSETKSVLELRTA